jgi:hypothetical protein
VREAQRHRALPRGAEGGTRLRVPRHQEKKFAGAHRLRRLVGPLRGKPAARDRNMVPALGAVLRQGSQTTPGRVIRLMHP